MTEEYEQQLKAALLDADHEWALWREKWTAALDLMGSQASRADRAEAALEKAEQRNARQAVIIGDCSYCTLINLDSDDAELDRRATEFRKQLAADLAALHKEKP